MSVEEAILELLKAHNRVILPGFGAFLVAKDDPEDKPYILFNSFLSFNDGLLIGYLSEQNGQDAVIVTDQVGDYVSLLKTTLAEDRLYKFNFLGTFDFEEGGSMRFKFNPNTGKLPVKGGGHGKPIVVKKEVSKKDESKVEIVTPVIATPIEIIKSDKPIDLIAKDDLLNFDTSTATPNIIIEQDNSPQASSNISFKEQKFELVEEKYVKPSQHSSDGTVDSNPLVAADSDNGKKKVVIVITAIIVVACLLVGYIFFVYLPNKNEEEARKVAMENEAKRQTVLKHQSDSIAIVKVRELAIADSIRIADELAQKTLSGGYHIVVGAFADEANADKLLAKVKTGAFPLAEKLASKKMFLVSVERCGDLSVANKRLSIVVNSLQMDCWIYKSK